MCQYADFGRGLYRVFFSFETRLISCSMPLKKHVASSQPLTTQNAIVVWYGVVLSKALTEFDNYRIVSYRMMSYDIIPFIVL